jgi:hypothetical protein
MKQPPLAALGVAALVSYAVHGTTHIRIGTPECMLWMCNAAVLVLGAGLLLSNARIIAIGFCWLVVGDIGWALDLYFGSDLLPTSLLTHVVGLVLALEGLRRLGFPAWTWPRAGLAVVVLQELTRLCAPSRSNVNVAFAMYPGSEHIFSSFGVYRVFVLALGVTGFALVELFARRLFPAPRRDSASSAAVNSPGQRAGDPQD